MSQPLTLTFVSFPSHRARQYALRVIEAMNDLHIPRKPHAYWSLRRKMPHGGIYGLTPAELDVVTEARDSGHGHVRFTRLRGPYADLMECWTWT